MGCTSAKQVSAVPNDEEGQNKAYGNGELLSGWSRFSRPSPSYLCSCQTLQNMLVLMKLKDKGQIYSFDLVILISSSRITHL